MTIKKTYEKPMMEVDILQQQEHLLSGSNSLRGEISGYNKSSGGFSQDDEEEPEEPSLP